MPTPTHPVDASARRAATILIVEDDLGAMETFEHMLKTGGYDVRTAGDGQAALVEVERTRPDAVILDLHLPMADATDLLRDLRASPRHARIPVAIVTGDYLLDEEVAKELHALGARIYFKPLWEDDLMRITRELLQQSR
jgi:CheY-like chemotaxis protein